MPKMQGCLQGVTAGADPPSTGLPAQNAAAGWSPSPVQDQGILQALQGAACPKGSGMELTASALFVCIRESQT